LVRTAAPIRTEPTIALEAAAVAAFHERGFITVPQISTPAELALLRRTFERLFAQRAGWREGAQFDLLGHNHDEADGLLPTILDPTNYAAELRRLRCRANAAAIAQQLLGPAATASFEHAILKPRRHGGATPWHQDEAYRADPDFEYEQVSIWMSLHDASTENGCMVYLPGSHRFEVLPHRSPNGDRGVHAIECAGQFDVAAAVACPLPAGGAAVHHGRTLHYAGPNHSDGSRCAYIFAYEIPPRAASRRRDFYWNRDRRDAANLVRRWRWRRKGGIFIEVARKLRDGIWHRPARLWFELRRALRAMCGR
jgi:ectoine hydroxylase-related dioxygenase (phytanoyl-CoA dioxygenase family)